MGDVEIPDVPVGVVAATDPEFDVVRTDVLFRYEVAVLIVALPPAEPVADAPNPLLVVHPSHILGHTHTCGRQ